MSTAVPARTNRSGSASPAMRCRPETSCLRQPARGQTHTSPCALSADRQRSGTQLLWIEQQSQAGPLVGSQPESMIVPRGARRSDQKAHPSRLEQACRFLRSWSCEFDSRPPLQQRNAWSGASLPRAMRLYHGNRARAITWAISPGGQGLSHATLEDSPRVRPLGASDRLDADIGHPALAGSGCSCPALTAHAEDHLPPLSPSSQGKRNFDRTERVEQAIRASQLQIEPSP
jgi:hypothetical protein